MKFIKKAKRYDCLDDGINIYLLLPYLHAKEYFVNLPRSHVISTYMRKNIGRDFKDR